MKMSENINILIVILSCHKNKHLWKKLLAINPNSIIFCANPYQDDEFTFKDRILTLKCYDTYDFLPVKVFLMIQSILKIPQFKNISHILKVDDHDTKFDKDIIMNIKNINNISQIDFCGQRINGESFKSKVYPPYGGDRRWHFNKCPKDSIWYNKIYEGPYVPWTDGGCGYILSKKSLQIISKENFSEIKKHIYEDLMISIILFNNHIFPKQIPKFIEGDK